MDTTNRPESNLPARLASSASRLPAPIQMSVMGGAPGGGGSPATSMNPRTLLRGLIRHWWHILGLSIICSLPALYLIYIYAEPKYEASGTIRVEPATATLYSASMGDGDRGFAQNFLRTQIRMINNRTVLDTAASDPEIAKLPFIKNSPDYVEDLHKALIVDADKDSFLIRVSFFSSRRDEAFKIVDAVIRAYIEQVKNYARTSGNQMIASLQAEKGKLQGLITQTKSQLYALTEKGNVQFISKPSDAINADGTAAAEQAVGTKVVSNAVSEAEYNRFRDEYFHVNLELDAAEKILERKQKEADPSKQNEPPDVDRTLALAEINKQIVTAFRNDPDVASIVNELDRKEQEEKKVRIISRQGSDPALNWLKRDIAALKGQYNKLWEMKYDELKKRVMAASAGPGTEEGEPETLVQAQQRVAELTARKEALDKSLQNMDVTNKEARLDALKADIMRKELDTLQHNHTKVDDVLKQAEFEAGTEQVRVTIADDVRVPFFPSQNKRTKLMAATPFVVLGAFLGLFLLLEIKAERVSDPESLSVRVHSEVFALPPLPSAREVRKMRELEHGSDQIDRFIQRLDHLRFAVCGAQAPLDNGRCVLITSAVGGEGKTTLAAQLAARCGNAGMSTLLIDADLRRASLGSLLDVPEGPGLSDVLKGEVTIEEVAVPVQGGTFHLLLAGTPIAAVSRILNGPNFGILIAQLREQYDLIVIDSPPVLPVPDALILGQWADGAILASRFDISRFPQVERARRQLDVAGITVLGTVINGMRAADSYYGHYSYARKPQANSSKAS